MQKIAKTADISKLADIEESSRGSLLIIGDYSMIDSFVKIKFAGGLGNIVIGEHCYINSGTVIYSGNGIFIGNNVLIAANCTLAPVNHAYKDPDTLIRKQGFEPSKGGITIEDDVWIGVGTVVLDGAKIRAGSVIGACSLVIGETEVYSINSGIPIKKIGRRE